MKRFNKLPKTIAAYKAIEAAKHRRFNRLIGISPIEYEMKRLLEPKRKNKVLFPNK